MALLLEWSTKIITVPKTELTLVSGTHYTITVDYWWQLLREANYDAEGMVFDTMYNSIAPTSSTPRIVEVVNGYTVQFENGLYSVEFINGNTNFRDVEIKNTVSVGTNNTTGFIDPTFLEAGLFTGGLIVVDVINGVSGTDKTPQGGIIGTSQTPSNNFIDAKTIAVNRGLRDFLIINSATIVSVDFSVGYNFVGTTPFVQLTLATSADMTNCSMTNLTVVGELDGLNVVTRCTIGPVTNLSGFIEKCAFTSTASISGPTFVFECYSQVTGTGHPIFSVGNNDIGLRDCHGSFGFADMTGGVHTIQIEGGRAVLYPTCIGGDVFLRGTPYEITDNSNGTSVVDQTESKKIIEMSQLQGLDINNPMTVTPSSRVAGDIDLAITGDGSTTSTVTRQ